MTRPVTLLRTIRRAVTVVAVTAACTVAAAGGAAATDYEREIERVRSETTAALRDAMPVLPHAGTEGDFTCAAPVVVLATVPAGSVVVADVYGLDVAQAAAACVGYQGGSATATLSMWIEYQPYPGAAYQPIPGCPGTSVTQPAVAGVHVMVTPTVTCQHRADSPAAGRPRRAHAVLSHSQAPTRQYHGYSTVYLDTYSS